MKTEISLSGYFYSAPKSESFDFKGMLLSSFLFQEKMDSIKNARNAGVIGIKSSTKFLKSHSLITPAGRAWARRRKKFRPGISTRKYVTRDARTITAI